MEYFIDYCKKNMGATVRAKPAQPDTVTLSDGSRVKLINKVLVKYEVKGKKGSRDSISYMIASVRRI